MPLETRRKTPLWDVHRQLGARLIDFGGWDLPVSYSAGTVKEHMAVRQAVGLFDVSHMGEVYLSGSNARDVVGRLTTNACESAPNGKAVYTLLCRPNGGIVDDCIFYKRADDDFLVIVNAANRSKDLAWFREHASTACSVRDASDDTALIAVQGPKAVAMVEALSDRPLATMPGFSFGAATVGGTACMVARTGYTGEDGFELACDSRDAVKLWGALYEAAIPIGGLPIGLGARDTLRLEARLPLYGQDLDDDHTPLEAGLGWAVKFDKPDFVGKTALVAQRSAGLTRRLAAFAIDESARAIARHGYAVVEGPQPVGVVTSGGPGIAVGGAIGLAYVPAAMATPGSRLTIDCRGKLTRATVVSGKFYQREK